MAGRHWKDGGYGGKPPSEIETLPPDRDDLIQQKNMADVAARYCRGEAHWKIQTETGLPAHTVNALLHQARVRWLKASTTEFAAMRAEQMAKIDNIETTAWEAWKKSNQDEITVNLATDSLLRELKAKAKDPDSTRGSRMPAAKLTVVKKTERTTTKDRVGHPAFLELAKWCVEARMKLLGLAMDAAPAVAGPRFDWDALYTATPVVTDPAAEKILQLEQERGARVVVAAPAGEATGED